MVYELSGNYAIILPLMVTCTLASAFCHVLLERGQVKVESDRELLRSTKVSALMVPVSPVPPEVRLRELTDALISSEHGALPVLNAHGKIGGVAFLQDLRELWRDDFLGPTVNAQDVARAVPVLQPEQELGEGLDGMDQEDVDALPVVDASDGVVRYAILSRTAIRRFLHRAEIRRRGKVQEPPVAASEV
jgi:CIC family chloride channel protein